MRLLCLTTVLASIVAGDCRIDYDGKSFDISSLQKAQDNYVVEAPQGNTISGVSHLSFYLNVCKDVNQKHYDNGTTLTPGLTLDYAAVVFNPKTSSTFKLGKTSSAKMYVVGDQAFLQYSGGSMCQGEFKEGAENSISIKMICDNNDGYPRYVYDDGCSYFFEWRTKVACSKASTSTPPVSSPGSQQPGEQAKGGMSAGGVFGILVLVGVSVYFIGGIVYNRSNGVRGWKQIPNFDLWNGLWKKVTGSSSRSRYQHVSVPADTGLMSDSEEHV